MPQCTFDESQHFRHAKSKWLSMWLHWHDPWNVSLLTLYTGQIAHKTNCTQDICLQRNLQEHNIRCRFSCDTTYRQGATELCLSWIEMLHYLLHLQPPVVFGDQEDARTEIFLPKSSWIQPQLSDTSKAVWAYLQLHTSSAANRVFLPARMQEVFQLVSRVISLLDYRDTMQVMCNNIMSFPPKLHSGFLF